MRAATATTPLTDACERMVLDRLIRALDDYIAEQRLMWNIEPDEETLLPAAAAMTAGSRVA
jgi:hypothetical protein